MLSAADNAVIRLVSTEIISGVNVTWPGVGVGPPNGCDGAEDDASGVAGGSDGAAFVTGVENEYVMWKVPLIVRRTPAPPEMRSTHKPTCPISNERHTRECVNIF
jgi:hypothetical protein